MVRVLYFIAYNQINGKQKHHNGYATGDKSFPSNTTVNITLPASSVTSFTYVAPANGFAMLNCYSTSHDIYDSHPHIKTNSLQANQYIAYNGYLTIPVTKGQTITFDKSDSTNCNWSQALFIYAQGEI